MKGYSFSVSRDPAPARDIVYGVLEEQGFTVRHKDEWSADAERGSLGMTVILGAFAGKKGRHIKLHISCQPGVEETVIALTRGTIGIAGGLISVIQADRIYTGIYNAIRTAFQTAGIMASGAPLR